MTDKLVDLIILELNLGKIRSKKEGGMLYPYNLNYDDMLSNWGGMWENHPCRLIPFEYDSESGIIFKFHPFNEVQNIAPYGIFRVAIESRQIDTKKYRIVETTLQSDISERACRRILGSSELFNMDFCFDMDHDGFSFY